MVHQCLLLCYICGKEMSLSIYDAMLGRVIRTDLCQEGFTRAMRVGYAQKNSILCSRVTLDWLRTNLLCDKFWRLSEIQSDVIERVRIERKIQVFSIEKP